MASLFPFVQTVFWAALGAWFGSAVFAAMAAGVIHRVVRQHDPTLPRVLQVNLDGQHSTLLAGDVVFQLLRLLQRVGIACAVVLFLVLMAQISLTQPVGFPRTEAIIRVTLFAAAVVTLVFNGRFVWPAIARHRNTYIEHADTPEIANPALEQLDHYQREAALVLYIQLVLLLAMILFSVNVTTAVSLVVG
jgi:hypothetical protein